MNDGRSALILDRSKYLVAIVALVGDHIFRRESLQQWFGLSDVVRLAGRQPELHRVAQAVAGGMDFGSKSTA